MSCLSKYYLLPFFIVSLFYSCQKSNAGGTKGIDESEFSPERQETIGSMLENAIASQVNLFDVLSETQYPQAYAYLQDSVMNSVVNTAAVKRRSDFNWKVVILNDDTERNAFILPGGRLYVYTGMLKYMNNNAELFGVFAHEIAYADSDRAVDNLLDRFGGVNIGKLAKGESIPQLVDIVDYVPGMEYQRDDVLFADSFAMEVICPFNYEPLALLDIIERAADSPDIVNWEASKNCEFSDRRNLIERINNENIDCGSGANVTLEEAYKRFMDYLP